MKKICIKLIDIYQSIPGPWHDQCRFTPTCSQYMKEAIIKHGCYRGILLGLKRLLRCHPFGKFGYDPVPDEIKKRSK